MMRGNLPLILPHMRIGLFGGSFDPAHQGHLHVSKVALKQLGLHKIIWLISPQNPLKAHKPASIADRLTTAQNLTQHPRINVSNIESEWNTLFAIDTIHRFQTLYPNVEFIWIIGSDNWAGFHKWRGWEEIVKTIPIAIYPRPGTTLKAGLGPAAQRFQQARRDLSMPNIQAPAWQILGGPYKLEASREMRAKKVAKHLN